VSQTLVIVLRVIPELGDGKLTMTLRLWIVETAGVILDNPDLDQIVCPDTFEFVGGGDDSIGSSADVIVEVVGNDCARSEEIILSVQDQAGPGELVRLSLALRQRPWAVLDRKAFPALKASGRAAPNGPISAALPPYFVVAAAQCSALVPDLITC